MSIRGLLSAFASVVLFVVTTPAASGTTTDYEFDIEVPGLCSLASIMHPAYKCEEYHVCIYVPPIRLNFSFSYNFWCYLYY